MSKENAGIMVLNTHVEAENAVKELARSGFDMKKLSIAGKNYHTEEHVVGYYNAGDRMVSGANKAPSGVDYAGFY